MKLKFKELKNGGSKFIVGTEINGGFFPCDHTGETMLPGSGAHILMLLGQNAYIGDKPKNCVDTVTGRLYDIKPDQTVLLLAGG